MTAGIPRLAANRRNAQKSTGPKTQKGKARSSHNAWKAERKAAEERAARMAERLDQYDAG